MNTINCLECGHDLDENEDSCASCAWTYKTEGGPQIHENAQPVCLKCLAAYEPLEHYCRNCGHVVGKYTAYQPFEGIRFSYSLHRTVWHKVWHENDTSMLKKVGNLLFLLFIEPIYTLFVPIELIRKKLTKKGKD